MGQKDLAAKDLESRPEVFADIINALIYEGEQIVSPEQLRSAPTETLYESLIEELDGKADEDMCGRLRNQYNDVSKYETEEQRIRIQYVLENESSENYRLILRKAGYEGAIYRSEYEEKRLFPVAMLVLYWGNKEWKPCSELHEFFGENLVDSIVKEYVDNIKLHMFPMAHLPEEVRKRFKSDMRIIVDYLAEGASYEPSNRTIKYIEPVMRMLYAYTGEKGFLNNIVKLQSRQEKGEEVTMDAAVEKFVMRGRKQGIQQGMDLIRILLENGREEDVKRSLEDKEYREKMFQEFDL